MPQTITIWTFAITLLLTACASQIEEGNDMLSSATTIAAVDEQLGMTRTGAQTTFRVYAPAQDRVFLLFFKQAADTTGISHPMHKQANGVWSLSVSSVDLAPYYAYSLHSQAGPFVADPYSRAVVRQNNFRYPSKTVILPEAEFDWGQTEFIHQAPSDLVILEAHLRDLTVHQSSGSKAGGTYLGFIEPGQKGGLRHLKDLGFNAVEFLPLQEFGNIEIDYQNPDLDIWNDWNPYETNHWGYMTSFFFAPEIYYGSDGTSERGVWVGQDGRAVQELQQLVKTLHAAGIAVIMDVVYNHVSQYDANPFKLLDKQAYFRLDAKGGYLSHSGCGNDFQTENPMSRKLIVESLTYWMTHYHIDGFRFDLAAMIDLETVDAITATTQAINPDVILIGEPWGGGAYNPAELADHGWAAWNDHFRNSIKGRNPRENDSGLIFGRFWDGHDIVYYENLMQGYPQSENGFFHSAAQSVNYLESHDDYTLGDFIRLTLGKVGPHELVTRKQVAVLSPEELRIHKFAALNLLTSQGPVMIAEGQTWGRAKVIANSIGTDPHAGQLDHNSYEKDDETNWLNWDEKQLNSELVDYYRGLIAIRAQQAELRDCSSGLRKFFSSQDSLAYGFSMQGQQTMLVLINANAQRKAQFKLPTGTWQILADAATAGTTSKGRLTGSADILPLSGLILLQ